MAEENHCPQCGAELLADAPQGMCPKCLMKLGLPTGAEADKAGASKPTSDVPTSATPPAGFVPPEPAELAKQFPQLEILELLGQGGIQGPPEAARPPGRPENPPPAGRPDRGLCRTIYPRGTLPG